MKLIKPHSWWVWKEWNCSATSYTVAKSVGTKMMMSVLRRHVCVLGLSMGCSGTDHHSKYTLFNNLMGLSPIGSRPKKNLVFGLAV